eukprot:1270875-Amorphochlora_amoeboformis.AAC.1
MHVQDTTTSFLPGSTPLTTLKDLYQHGPEEVGSLLGRCTADFVKLKYQGTSGGFMGSDEITIFITALVLLASSLLFFNVSCKSVLKLLVLVLLAGSLPDPSQASHAKMNYSLLLYSKAPTVRANRRITVTRDLHPDKEIIDIL